MAPEGPKILAGGASPRMTAFYGKSPEGLHSCNIPSRGLTPPASVPDMDWDYQVEKYLTEEVTTTVAKPQGLVVRRS